MKLIDGETVQERIDTLRRLLLEEREDDDPREPLHEESFELMKAFLDRVPSCKRPGIFALRNGHARALWIGGEYPNRQQIGIQFMPDGDMQYILFDQNDDHWLGYVSTADEMIAIVKTHGLEWMWSDTA
jgi:hypothetical protein